ncbi:tetratricopeptide repeat protein [Paraherbaspirillum soli]|uniref:Tetratricopeptide repeat protein n=1 Tax=Paraherbaspirillum soli TaxID=631222 RepID=A0ABW0MBH8_9BURK
MRTRIKNQILKLTALSLMAAAISAAVVNTANAASDINVQILSATIKDRKIDGATVTLQKNGEQSATATTNAQGQVSLNTAFADDPSVLLIVKKSGYSNLVVKCPCSGTTYAISPVMNNLDGMRVVLNWGAEPRDLDSHIVYPANHVYFMNMKGTDALLDVDNTTGFGPETITINRKHDGERYVYAVHNFSDGSNPNSDRLSKSGAKVFVYVGQTLIKTYYVPTNKVGNLWTVFAVTEAGEFQDFNTIKGVTSHDRLQTSEFQGVINHSEVQTVSYSASNQDDAKSLNKQGEDAYHAGNYDESIRLYQAAIELNGNYGQAYSNLGLVFQKAGRVAEAMWANRKAIALANGPTAATVRASSHYNNAKIYEAAEQWNDALREYKYANGEKNNPVYDKAIQRMQQKGAK